MKKLLLICLLFSYALYGQKSEEYQQYKKLYPNAYLVRLHEETTFKIQIENEQLKVTRNTFEEDLYLAKTANFNSKRTIGYSSFFDLKEIEAASLTFSGNKYQENEVKEFNQKNDLDDTFYNDSKTVSFIYPKLQEGSKTKISYSYDIKNPRFLSAFYFADYHPIINRKVTIIADKNVSLDFKEFHTEGANINFEKKKKGRNWIYTWTQNKSQKFEYEEGAPNARFFLPHIIPIITSYKTKKGETPILNGVGALHDWYYSLVSGINQQEKDQDLEALVASLTERKTNDLEKVKAIYYWTQKNIKYIAFEYALGGFIPREANDVFQKKYGDCKDNSSILSEMLSIAGLEGNLTWIGTREIPYTYEDVPTPAVDNHMILSYEHNSETYYLDATGRYVSIDYPTSFIQGKEALVTYGKGKFKVKQVPVMAPEKSQLIDRTFVQIDGNKLIGKSTATLSGYLKQNIFYDLELKKKEKDILDFYNGYFQKGSNKFLIQSFKEENKYSYDKDFQLSYDFTISDYVQTVGSEIFINPHFNQKAKRFKTKKDRKNDVEYDFKRQYSYTNTIAIPDGFIVDYLPSNVALDSDFVSVNINYQQKEGQIVVQSNVIWKALYLNLEYQKEVNAIIKKAQKAYKEIIILKKQ